MILIGSRALALRAPNILSRKPLDFDFISTQSEFEEWVDKNKEKINSKEIYEASPHHMVVKGSSICEFEIITPNSSSELLLNLVEKDSDSTKTDSFGIIPSINVLFAIKSSHKYKKFKINNTSFWKHTLDYHRMKAIGAEVKDEYKEFISLREKETYTYAHPSLNKNKTEFFEDDNIEYIYQHDDLHKVVAINEKPAYEYYLKDNHEVLTDKKKFFACSEHIRLSGCIEEAAVLCLERSLIPFPNTWTPEFGWRFALSKVCTSITSGYFREYCFDNVFKILQMYPKYCANFYEKFISGVECGIVRKVKF